MRFWRNTSVAQLAAGATATLPDGTLGYEWDEDPDNGFRPAGSFGLSSTTVSGAPVLQDHGSVFGSGIATHRMTLYRHSSGSLVFGAGTVQWSWGLDNQHDRGSEAADVRMQQATLNLLADMGAQPATLQAGLAAASASTDAAAPSSTISSPAAGAQVESGRQITITGSATDAGGGVVGGVEVSVNGGATWHRATGRGSWSYNWTPSGSGSFTIRTRAVDDSGNLETPSAGVSGSIGSASCPCSIWSASTLPANETEPSDTNAVELGVKFRAQVDGQITGLRFYKGTTNTGTHVGHLWSRTGTMLAEATFTRRECTRLAGSESLQPGLDQRRHDLRRLLPRSGRPLRLEPQLLRQLRRRQRTAARPLRRRGRRQRRLRLRPQPHLPQQHLPVRELLGRRRIPAGHGHRHDPADHHRVEPGERRRPVLERAPTSGQPSASR